MNNIKVSRKIENMLAVLTKVKEGYDDSMEYIELNELFRQAIDEVSSESRYLGDNNSTVKSNFTRKGNTLNEWLSWIFLWLNGDKSELEMHLDNERTERYASGDYKAIKKFFAA